MKAEEIVELIKEDSSQSRLYMSELRLGAGYEGVAQQRIDLMSIETAPSKSHRVVGYEIKVSRADFLRDIKSPRKQVGARLFCDQLYFVAPDGLVGLDELPPWAGLQSVVEGRVRVVAQAPLLEKVGPTWGLVVAVARNASQWDSHRRRLDKAVRENMELQGIKRDLQAAIVGFEQLHAVINGECPSLLEDDAVSYDCISKIEKIKERLR